jgi:hypothetical protein
MPNGEPNVISQETFARQCYMSHIPAIKLYI